VKVAGYVLGGGGSTRFGRDKALAQIGGKPMLIRMRDLLGSVTHGAHLVAAPGRYANLGADLVADRWPGEGPLGGIVTALLTTTEASGEQEWNLIVGCDMPFLRHQWLAYMIERALASRADVVVPQSEHGLEPLCACWRSSVAGKLQRVFEGGVRKIAEAMKHLKMEVLDETHWKRFDSAGRLFWNMNTAADYDEAKRILEAGNA
jgi:molybdopterin-guanine dinucleotide biosynthesis protein A